MYEMYGILNIMYEMYGRISKYEMYMNITGDKSTVMYNINM